MGCWLGRKPRRLQRRGKFTKGFGTYPTYQTEVLEPQFPQDFKSCEAEDFSKLCAKYVRRNHVRTSNNWLKQKVVPNLLASNFDKKVD